MEEWVGEKWHHFITGRSQRRYLDAAVRLDDIRQPVAVFFRALGGDAGIELGHTSAKPLHSHRNWLQKIAGTGKKAELGHFSGEHLYLPEQLDVFPNKPLNTDLYYWLAAMASFNHAPHPQHIIEHNQYLTLQVLQHWPGMQAVYNRVKMAELKQRPPLSSLPEGYKSTEILIRKVLQNPEKITAFDYQTETLSQPVMLWLNASFGDDGLSFHRHTEPQSPQLLDSPNKPGASIKKYQAEQVDEQHDKDGFMSFRLESMFSWSEFISLDRNEDDGDDEDVMRVAEDLDQLSVSQGESGHKIRLDLDLPASDYDDVLLEGGILMPEWDYKKQQYLRDHCAVQLMALRLTEVADWPAVLKQQAQGLKRQFEALKPIHVWQNNQSDGDEIDFDAYLQHHTARQLNHSSPEVRLYRQKKQLNRDLSTLILTDLSLSTDAYVSDDKKVIDVIKESLYLLSSGLAAANERFAIAGFTSKKRTHVRYYAIKDFDQAFDAHCENQIYAIKPAYYTRMGTAIRYATDQLTQQSSTQKLLFILTDGKPNDLDRYESRYGLEDTKQAIIEARQLGLTPFCVSIDFQASDYLPYLFGSQGFIHVKNALQLPKKLPKVFLQLTQ